MFIKKFHVFISIFKSSLVFVVLVSSSVFGADGELKLSIDTCVTAVSHAARYGDASKGVAELRFNANKMSLAAYQELIKQIDEVKSTFTVANCMASVAKETQIYDCLAAGDGNYTVCGG